MKSTIADIILLVTGLAMVGMILAMCVLVPQVGILLAVFGAIGWAINEKFIKPGYQ